MTPPSSPATANTRRYSCACRARHVGADPRRRAARRGPPLWPIRRGGHHLAAIAAEAGVAAETIYTGFSSTKALLRPAMDVAIVGDAQPVPLIDREEFQQLDSVLAAIMLFGMPLPTPDADRYVSEMTLAAELPGVPRDIIPTDVAALDRYLAAGRLQLRCTPAAA